MGLCSCTSSVPPSTSPDSDLKKFRPSLSRDEFFDLSPATRKRMKNQIPTQTYSRPVVIQSPIRLIKTKYSPAKDRQFVFDGGDSLKNNGPRTQS